MTVQAEAPHREYALLSNQIRQAGLLERRPRYYAWQITITTVLLAAGWAGFVLVGDSWWQLAVAAFLAVMFTQAGFLGHDAGHRQILGSRRGNYVLGVLHGNLGIGLSYGWWVRKHNRHHAHPNTE
ncbi:MAG TPA: fatty acid desaturase, partial [Streptosporangiaceae bacterium]|nr:fatty acid desaturase [Streptosporangiaceae bacterium]